MKTSYREQPNGYLETIQKGMSAVRYFNRKMSYGKGTREEQICRLKKEIEEADHPPDLHTAGSDFRNIFLILKRSMDFMTCIRAAFM